MNIRNALTNLIVIEAGLTITVPLTRAVVKAWPYFPPQTIVFSGIPAWTNSWDLTREERHPGGFREQFYTIHMQFYAAEIGIEQDMGADIATAFMDKLLTALDADITLGDTITDHIIRGGSPTLAVLERAGKPYIGLDLFMDAILKDTATFG